MNRSSYCVIGSWLLAAANTGILVYFIGFDITRNNASMAAPIVGALLALVCLFLASSGSLKGNFLQRILVIPPALSSLGVIITCLLHVVLIKSS